MNSLTLRTQVEHDPGDRPCLRPTILIDDQPLANLPFDGLGVDLYELIKARQQDGEFFIVTCACGDAGCANITHGVQVVHHGQQVRWTERYAEQPRKLVFDKGAYEAAIDEGLEAFRQMLSDHPTMDVVPWSNRYVFDERLPGVVLLG